MLGVRIDNAIRSLSEMPDCGRPGAIPATRELPVRRAPYVFVYTVGDEGVFVLRIRHTSQDPSP
jgi:plasmid stabilization system protein ParE